MPLMFPKLKTIKEKTNEAVFSVSAVWDKVRKGGGSKGDGLSMSEMPRKLACQRHGRRGSYHQADRCRSKQLGENVITAEKLNMRQGKRSDLTTLKESR